MATVTLTFNPNEFAIDGCARCDALLTAFKDQVIAQGILQRDTVMLLLSVWLQDTSNRLEIFLNDGSQTIVYADGGTGPGQEPVFNCAAFSDEVFADGFPNCSEVSRAFGVRALGLFAPEDSVPFTAEAQVSATVGEVPAPILTVEEQPPNPVCAVEPFETREGTLESPIDLQEFSFNGGLISLTGSCGDYVLEAREGVFQSFNCANEPVEFNLPSEYACSDITYTFTVTLVNCPEKRSTVDVVVRRIGSPCFECPPDRCAIESCDFNATLAALKEEDRVLVLESATNGCGSSEFNKQVTCEDNVVCNRCHRGELVVERTWSLQNLDCFDPPRITTCVQRLRLVNTPIYKRWQCTFPCLCNACECNDDAE
jgi:hypothetical protein